MHDNDHPEKDFPVCAGLLFGLGLGGFFDGILLHQVLQWHHMLSSAGYPATSVQHLEVNTLWDGLFHVSTYVCVVLGLLILWWAARRTHVRWSSKLLIWALLVGFGLFNLIEGVIDHHLLGLHHVNETVPPAQWIYWDSGFLVWGALMLLGGWRLLRAGWQETPAPRSGTYRSCPLRPLPTCERAGTQHASRSLAVLPACRCGCSPAQERWGA